MALVVAAAAACAALAASAGDGKPPSAVAGTLPNGYRLVLTDEHGTLHLANYAKHPTIDGDGPLTVATVRGHGKTGGYEHDPTFHRGDRRTTIRGHHAVVRTLTDEGERYARELVWRERRNLVVVVTGTLALRTRQLRRVAEGVRLLGTRAWALLYRQTSYDAQAGHVTRTMRRLRVKVGRHGHRWALYALIPPRFPLSRNDLRASCVELRHRGARGHGDSCAEGPNWQRVGGDIFVFGEVPRRVKHVRIRPWEGGGFDLRTRTRRARRGPRVRYFARPLPEGSCGVRITPASHPHAEPWIAAPVHGPDNRRCAGHSEPPPPP